MIQPRNTLVVVKLIEQASKQFGAITVPTGQDEFCEATVVAIGPGNVAADGGRSETFDLKPGQRVFMKYRRTIPGRGLQSEGMLYRIGTETYYLFEQTNILGIVGEQPVELHA